MNKIHKLKMIVRIKAHLYPEKADYYHNLYNMFVSGNFTYDSILAEVKRQ